MEEIDIYIAVAFWRSIQFLFCFWIFLLNRRQTVKVFSLSLIKLRWLFLLVTQVSGCRMLGIRLRMEQMKCGLLRVIRMLIIMRPIMCSMIKVVPQAFILPLIPALSVCNSCLKGLRAMSLSGRGREKVSHLYS